MDGECGCSGMCDGDENIYVEVGGGVEMRIYRWGCRWYEGDINN